MKKILFNSKHFAMLLMVSLSTLVSCSSSDDSTPAKPEETPTDKYAILTGTLGVSPYVGYLSTFDQMPTGDIDNIKQGSLSVKANGMKFYGSWIFQRIQLGRTGSPDDGILKYALDAKGNLVESGEIKGLSSNFYVHSESQGYYTDAGRGLLKIQIFSPTSMKRTGEIDLSMVADPKVEYQAVGTNFLASKDGKLYADIITGTALGKGNGMTDPARGYIDIAVIDIATGRYEKTIRDSRISFIGYPGNANQMWTLGDDGALYLCSHGFGVTGSTNGSAIVRIKKGETETDKSWIIKINDYVKNTTVGSIAVKNGKLYTAWSSSAFLYTGILEDVNFTYYSFEKENIAAGPKPVAGIPQSTYAFQDAQAISTIDNKVYFRVVDKKSFNGYYILSNEDTTAKPAFNIGKGGSVWGLAKLKK